MQILEQCSHEVGLARWSADTGTNNGVPTRWDLRGGVQIVFPRGGTCEVECRYRNKEQCSHEVGLTRWSADSVPTRWDLRGGVQILEQTTVFPRGGTYEVECRYWKPAAP